jgi:hypothetical protein
VRGRQAQLRAEFADWYPGIEPGTWHDATWVREMVLAQQRHGSPRWVLNGRVLHEGHFRFQGTAPGSRGQHQQRVTFPELT